jgi:peptidyl-prolyl cis-trans isomerase B (cyclophilin B)
MKLIATLCALLVLGQAPQPPFDVAQGRPFDVAQGRQRPLTPAPRPLTAAENQRLIQQEGGEPPEVLNAEKAWAGAEVLMPLVTSSDETVRRYALRAVGRLELPAQVPQLLAFANSRGASIPDIASAIAQSLKGFDAKADPDLLSRVLDWMRRTGLDQKAAIAAQVSAPIGRIVYANADQVHGAEEVLVHIIDLTANDILQRGLYAGALRSVESLARLSARVTSLAPETVTRLVSSVNGTSANDFDPGIRGIAVAALVSARAMDAETEKRALKEPDGEARRLAMTVLAGDGAGLDDASRMALIQEGLEDTSSFVRYEALRAYIRRGAQTKGCQPIVDLLSDRDSHVVLAALDALGDLCKADEDGTTRVTAEVRTPPVVGPWQRETHAFVALAKRSPERAAIAMEAFVTHPVWWVRLYAVKAAIAMEDFSRLGTLAYDTNDNVREAAIVALRRLRRAEAEPAIIAALDRSDYQLLRTAATLLKESPRDGKLSRPLIAALLRVTKEGKETSRDTRLPLLEAIAMHATAGNATDLMPLLKDVDPTVATKAAEVISQLTGKAITAQPVPVMRGWPRQFDNLNQCVVVDLKSGREFRLRMMPSAAPITVDHFLKLATRDHYYDGMTLHRVVPNFVVQGGSPDANEYTGHKDYMRDEIAATNARGTVGLSTRGRNTADAQFFINLVDNSRLDYDYTIFASVYADMGTVDAIEEGEEITRINLAACPRS